jgi:putative AlgH/UPF0301 family transcriptional regulator
VHRLDTTTDEHIFDFRRTIEATLLFTHRYKMFKPQIKKEIDMNYLTDSLLISNPAINDNPKFSAIAGSAIYIIEHTDEGAIGIGLNKNFSKPMNEIAEILPLLSKVDPETLLTSKVIMGGPLFDETPWILGRNADGYERSVRNKVLALNFAPEAFKQNQPAYFSICGVGSFGWSAGQLENEMAHFLWHHFPATKDVLEGIPFGPEVRGAVQTLLAMKFD